MIRRPRRPQSPPRIGPNVAARRWQLYPTLPLPAGAGALVNAVESGAVTQASSLGSDGPAAPVDKCLQVRAAHRLNHLLAQALKRGRTHYCL